MMIANYDVGKVYVDNGALVNVMFKKLFDQLGLKKDDLSPSNLSLKAFNGNLSYPLKQIALAVRTGPVQTIQHFVVLEEHSAYNVIMGRPWLHAIEAVPSTYHQSVRFPGPEGIMELCGNQAVARECFMYELTGHTPSLATKKKEKSNIHPEVMEESGTEPKKSKTDFDPL